MVFGFQLRLETPRLISWLGRGFMQLLWHHCRIRSRGSSIWSPGAMTFKGSAASILVSIIRRTSKPWVSPELWLHGWSIIGHIPLSHGCLSPEICQHEPTRSHSEESAAAMLRIVRYLRDPCGVPSYGRGDPPSCAPGNITGGTHQEAMDGALLMVVISYD